MARVRRVRRKVVHAARVGLMRSWRNELASDRSDLWNAVFQSAVPGLGEDAGACCAAVGGGGGGVSVADSAADARIGRVSRRNLEQWPLELVDWAVDNSQRTDVVIRPTVDRWRRTNTQSMRPLPANERSQ